jgi:hypothetical protein
MKENKSWQGCEEKETFVRCWCENKFTQLLWNIIIWRFLKKLLGTSTTVLAILRLGTYPK